jgi:adhesin/invasin
MTNILSRSRPRRVAALLGAAAMIGACSKDSNNTAPLVASTVSSDVATNGQTALVGTALLQPVAVHVMDQNGGVVAGATVTWTVLNGAGTTSAATSVTDATGTATVVWTIDTIARVDSMTASIQSGASTTLFATGTAGAATSAMKVSGDSQTVTSDSTSAPLVVKVVDRYGNPVAGVAVAWVVTGGGTLSAASTNTDATGTAKVTLTLGATPGPYTIVATAGLLAAITFNLTGT